MYRGKFIVVIAVGAIVFLVAWFAWRGRVEKTGPTESYGWSSEAIAEMKSFGVSGDYGSHLRLESVAEMDDVRNVEIVSRNLGMSHIDLLLKLPHLHSITLHNCKCDYMTAPHGIRRLGPQALFITQGRWSPEGLLAFGCSSSSRVWIDNIEVTEAELEPMIFANVVDLHLTNCQLPNAWPQLVARFPRLGHLEVTDDDESLVNSFRILRRDVHVVFRAGKIHLGPPDI